MQAQSTIKKLYFRDSSYIKKKDHKETMSEPEVVCRNKRCREIVRELKKSDVISVDAEGVNLGKEGPLTLLQIGTIDGHVYLFDVHINPDIFQRGKLIEILQSDKIVKVSNKTRSKLNTFNKVKTFVNTTFQVF